MPITIEQFEIQFNKLKINMGRNKNNAPAKKKERKM